MTPALPKHQWLYLVLPFAIGYYISYLLRNANAVIAPVLTRELSLDAADLGLLTSAYFFAFGAFQIPLGILLDRYGPRRVEATLLLFAAAGSAVFALGHNIGELTLGRGLIGFGVSACLMAALKNFTQWYPHERQTSLTGVVMTAGGLGALSASVPMEALLPLIGWRGVFLGLTGVILAAAVLLFFLVPDRNQGVTRSSLAQQWAGVVEVFASRHFWRFAPQTVFFAGGFMAIQGLWAVPWLMNVDGLTRGGAAQYLFVIGLATLAGFAAVALFAARLIRGGVRPTLLLGGALALGWCCQALMVVGVQPALPLWVGYAFCFSVTQLTYTILTQRFALALSGRVTTAINLMAFVGAFSLQWGIGVIVDILADAGTPLATSHRAALALVAVLQMLAWAWFVAEGRREQTVGRASLEALPPAP